MQKTAKLKYRVIHKSVKHFKNSPKIYTQRIMGILTPIKRETLQVFFTYFTDSQCVFWGFVKHTVFVPPLPANLQDHLNRITAAVARVDRDMLTHVWNEMDYRIDVCHITKDGHIDHL
jgi:hypothetical protein